MTHTVKINFYNDDSEYDTSMFIIKTNDEIGGHGTIEEELQETHEWLDETEEGIAYRNEWGRSAATVVQRTCEKYYWDYEEIYIEKEIDLK